ncbi:MAG TPA: hypothetical protein VLA36_01650 [Longimicrobiales bacterium]|nr:hypothetical protein [Longimicrobiales bacterium]
MARTRSTVREGIVVGLIGFTAVALFYTLFDLLAGQGFLFTLNLLGKVIFRGVRDPAVLQLPIARDVGAMAAYNCLHLVVSMAVGLFVSWLVDLVEESPRRGRPVALVMAAGYVATVSAVALFARDVAPLIPFWSVVAVNTLAALGGGLYLWRTHPGLWGRVRAGGKPA